MSPEPIDGGKQGSFWKPVQRKDEEKMSESDLMRAEMNELQLQVGPYRTTFIGTEITRQSTKKEWENYGEILKRVDEAKQWAIGDWLVDGMNHFDEEHGEKKKH